MRLQFPVICGFSFYLPIALFAAPIGNPSAPSTLEQGIFIPDTSWTNFQWGVAGNWLAQQRFCARTSSQTFGLRRADIRGVSELGNATWNIAERLNLQIELGSGQFQWKWKQNHNIAISGHLKGGLLWSGSAKFIIFEIKDTSFAADVCAGGWDWMQGYADANGIPLSAHIDSEMRFWQAGSALSQKIGLFIPYIGMAANRSRIKISKPEFGIGWLRSRHTLGPFFGCTVTNGTDIALNMEWRTGFEQAGTFSGQIRF
ncbi:MAG TPA: hypothetical protein VLE95_01140 [Chlamydiales bacterium]|nr:hypothetical protein [Chlamydiales bacterium]